MTHNRKTVRIFVSSTFKDMDVERDTLRNYVVPLLNDRLRFANIHVQLIDLRHSIETSDRQSEDEREKMIFDICMDEIKSCRPFFIGLVGHRYGWIPDNGPDNVALPTDFPLGKDEISVTTHEFLNGPLRNNNDGHALIFIRDAHSYDKLSDKERAMHIEQGENSRRVEALRSYLAARKEINAESYCADISTPGSKDWEKWGNHIAERLISIIRKEIGDNLTDYADSDTFLKTNRLYAENLAERFVGRKKIVDRSLEYFKERRSIYLQDTEPGAGSTSLLAKLYTTLSDDPSYLCLFYSPEASTTVYKYSEILYHWNLELCPILDFDNENIAAIRGDSAALFKTFCELALKIFETKGRKVVLFTDRAYELDEYFPLRQHFTLWAQTMEAGDKKSAAIIAATPVGEIDSDTFGMITARIRNSVSQALWNKKSARNVKWLTLAVNILESLNKIDYMEIRSTETKGNEERNITAYMESVVAEMPDDYRDLELFWTGRLRHVLGANFIDDYFGSLALCHSLNDEDIAAITGRSVTWCAWFRHMIGLSIVKPDDDGSVILNEDLRQSILDEIGGRRKSIAAKVYKYISALPAENPTRVNNIFAINLELRNYTEMIAYITDRANFTDYSGDSPAIMAFARMAANDTYEYIKVVEELVAQANPDAESFDGLCNWCSAVLNGHNYRLFIHTCMLMLNRLVELYNAGNLSSSGEMAMAATYYRVGGAFVEVDDGEKEWDKVNRNALMICRRHINESPQWNALYTTVLYDRYEGFTRIDSRWKFLCDEFRPIADSDFEWLPTSDFAGYMRLLRDMAILDTRFDINRDASAYALKAIDVADAIWNQSLLTDSRKKDRYDGLYELLFCAIAMIKQCRETGHPDAGIAVVRVKTILDEAFAHTDKNTKMKATAVTMAHLTYLYAEQIVATDTAEAIAAVDRIIDLLVYSDTPDTVGVDFMSQDLIHYHVLRQNFCKPNESTDYLNIAFAWCIAAKIVLDARLEKGLDGTSKYPLFDDDIEKVINLLQCKNEHIWHRELDPEFAVATAVYGKILSMVKAGKATVDELSFYLKVFFDTLDKTAPHYRYADRLQFAIVSSIRERSGISLDSGNLQDNEREPLSVEELENMIEHGDYNTIIETLGHLQKGTTAEIFYLALSLLRTGNSMQAAQYFKFLSGIDTEDENLRIASVINYFYSLLAAGQYSNFVKEYRSLPAELQDDSDLTMLYKAYKDAQTRADGHVDLPTPYGFTL